MAGVIYSPLISQISGKAGEAVFSRWKGRNYIRKRVIPAKSMLPGPVAARKRLTKVVAWYHDISPNMVLGLKAIAQKTTVSGFNLFCARNIKDIFDAVDERIMPFSAPRNPIAAFTAVTGTGSGELDFTWSAGAADPLDEVWYLVEPTATPVDQSAIEVHDTGSLVTDLAATSDALTPGVEYNIWMLLRKPATVEYSIALKDTATTYVVP